MSKCVVNLPTYLRFTFDKQTNSVCLVKLVKEKKGFMQLYL